MLGFLVSAAKYFFVDAKNAGASAGSSPDMDLVVPEASISSISLSSKANWPFGMGLGGVGRPRFGRRAGLGGDVAYPRPTCCPNGEG